MRNTNEHYRKITITHTFFDQITQPNSCLIHLVLPKRDISDSCVCVALVCMTFQRQQFVLQSRFYLSLVNFT